MLRIVYELGQGPLGFRDLQRRCDDMSSSVLANRLQQLREAGVVATDASGVSSLTALGARLGPALQPLIAWSRDWARTVTDTP